MKFSVAGGTDEAVRTETNNGGNSTSSINDETIAGFKVEDILNVVSKTADQGISIISNWFGISSEEEEKDPEIIESKTSEIINATQAVWI